MIDEVSLFFVELFPFPDVYLFLVYTYLLSSVHYFPNSTFISMGFKRTISFLSSVTFFPFTFQQQFQFLSYIMLLYLPRCTT